LINEGVKQRLGGLHSARLVLYSVDFAEIEALQAQGEWVRAGMLLADAARALKAAGAEGLVICTNTMHKVADAIQDASGLPLLHISDATGHAIRVAGLAQVALLGTRFTMEDPSIVLQRLRRRHGLQVLCPGDDDRAVVHRVIYDELCRGVVDATSRRAYVDTIERLQAQGAIPSGMSPADFAKFIAAETKKWATVVKASGATVD